MHRVPDFPQAKVETLSATEAVVNRILDMVNSGALRPGDQLPSEEDLSAVFGVGRSSIREAKRLLAARHVLESRVGVGSFVCEQSIDDALAPRTLHRLLSQQGLAALHEARELLEVRCAELAVERADDEDLARLGSIVQQMASAAQSGTPAVRAGYAFHAALIAATHNPVFERFYEVVVDLLQVHQAPMPDPRQEYEAHHTLYQALAARDRAGMSRLMQGHLQYVQQVATPR